MSNNVLSNEPSLDESIHFNSVNENALNLAVNLETFPEQSNDDDVLAAESENNASLSFNLPNQQASIKRKRKQCVPPVSITLNKLKLRNAQLLRKNKTLKQKLDRWEKTKVNSIKYDPKQDLINEASKYLNSNVLSFLAMINKENGKNRKSNLL